jgi:hypothetical protein
MYLNEVSGFSSSVVDLPPKDGMSRSGDYELFGNEEEDSLLDRHFRIILFRRLRLIGFEMSGF